MTEEVNPLETSIGKQFTQLINSIETTGYAILPQTNEALLRSIVETAARIFNAAAASILLVNEEEQVLEFRVAFGASNHDLVGMKFPLDKGIAGYVVMTGQPLSISNVRQDARFNQDFAKSTGYIPKSILATPLLVGEKTIGVMEVLDKVNEASFGIQDMELLALFARQAALAIDGSIKINMLNEALVLGLKRLAETEVTPTPDELLLILEAARDRQSGADLLALADLFNHISRLGEKELKACLQILKVFAEYERPSRRGR